MARVWRRFVVHPLFCITKSSSGHFLTFQKPSKSPKRNCIPILLVELPLASAKCAVESGPQAETWISGTNGHSFRASIHQQCPFCMRRIKGFDKTTICFLEKPNVFQNACEFPLSILLFNRYRGA